MPKLPTVKPSIAEKALLKSGFAFKRQKGSHKIFAKGIHLVTVPIHVKDLKKGTLKNIIKQSGMTLDEFIKLL